MAEVGPNSSNNAGGQGNPASTSPAGGDNGQYTPTPLTSTLVAGATTHSTEAFTQSILSPTTTAASAPTTTYYTPPTTSSTTPFTSTTETTPSTAWTSSTPTTTTATTTATTSATTSATTTALTATTASTTAASASASASSASSSSSSSAKWLPGVIVGSIAFVAILAGLAFWLIRRRRNNRNNQNYQPADQFDQGGAPLASPDIFGYRRPLMGMSQVDAERAEQERRDLIRKSMISHSSWSATQIDQVGQNDQYGNQYHNQYGQSQVDIAAAGQPNDSVGLRDDYKEWDAQMQQQKALLAAQHPSQAEVSQVEVPARQVSRERLRLDTRNVSPPPASPHQEEAFPVSPVSVVSTLPPVPTRSRKRPPSAESNQSDQTVTQYSPAKESSINVLPAEPFLSRRPTNQSTRSIARNPHMRHLANDTEPESPSSLYSVDLQDGRQNRAWANYHHDDQV